VHLVSFYYKNTFCTLAPNAFSKRLQVSPYIQKHVLFQIHRAESSTKQLGSQVTPELWVLSMEFASSIYFGAYRLSQKSLCTCWKWDVGQTEWKARCFGITVTIRAESGHKWECHGAPIYHQKYSAYGIFPTSSRVQHPSCTKEVELLAQPVGTRSGS